MNKPMKILTRGGLAALLVTLAACNQQVKSTDHCRLAPTSNVDRLFAQAHDSLEDSSCHYFWGEYREQLLHAAKGAPGPENEERFAHLIRQAMIPPN